MYKVTSYEVWKAPERPTDCGVYVMRTPIEAQAVGAVEHARRQGKVYIIKCLCDDGVSRYYA